MIACPSCGRDNVGVERLAEAVAERLTAYPEAFEVAVMGCAVNGPGEAGDADFGIAGGRDVGFVYAHGRVLKKVSVRDPDRRALRRDRPLDRRGHAATEAAEAREAGGGADGRGGPAAGRTRARDATRVDAVRASQLFIPTLRDDPAEAEATSHRLLVRGGFIRPGRSAASVHVPAARLACPPACGADHPRGDGRDRRPGDALPGADAGRAVAAHRPLRHPGGVPARGSGRPARSCCR